MKMQCNTLLKQKLSPNLAFSFCLLCLFVVLPLADSNPYRGKGKSAHALYENDTEYVKTREEKLLNIFQVVRFPNDPCNTTSNDMGVCFTASECASQGGTNSGSCASGFGVCCLFTIGCGAMTANNNTYFVSGEEDISPCSIRVCMSSDDICQLRLDFDTFNIAQPDGTAVTTTPTQTTQCIAATFTATSDGNTSPTLCGDLSSQHMIVEADNACNDIAFAWTAAGATPRAWRVRISQISCNDPNKPPEGCTQYFTGKTGNVQSYNFGSRRHLANQNYFACIRTEQGNCQIRWSHATGDFMIAATNAPDSQNLSDFCSLDYVLIPGGFTTIADVSTDRYCGDELHGYRNAINIAIAPATVMSTQQPFRLGFMTNANEVDTGLTDVDDDLSIGFNLFYEQTTC